jgi:SNF2 family DNA or RNA helicase
MEKMEANNIIEKDTYIKESKIGINADITGFGKTLSMIGLICRDKMIWDLDTPYIFQTVHTEAKGRIKNYFISRYDKLPCTLILVSQSIVSQWVNDLKKTNLKYYCFVNRSDIDNIELSYLENIDVIIVTSRMYNKLVSIFPNYCWKRFIFDEPGHIKVASMKEIHAGFYWFVTATPSTISSMHRNCKNSFMKDIVGSSYYNDIDTHIDDITIKNDPDFVKQSFKMPSTRYHYYECYQPILKVISEFINPTILTMIKAGNIEGALSALGGRKSSNIVEIIKSKKLEEIERINSKIKIYEIRNDIPKIQEWEQKKDKVEENLKIIDSKFNEILKNPCNICLEELKSPILEPNCQNIFCGSCLLTWINLKNSCPLCRKEINLSELIYIDEKKIGEKKENLILPPRKLTKEEMIVKIVKEKKDGSFIIFSEYDSSFSPITHILKETNIKFVQIRGSIKTRDKNIQMFRDNKVPVIFINSKHNCCGVNLQGASDIIMYHDMNTITTNQIIGRANRIGRKIPLDVHYL